MVSFLPFNLLPSHFLHFWASSRHCELLSLMFPSTVFVLTAWNTPSSPTPALCFLLGRFHVLSLSDWMVLAQRGCPWSFIKQVPVPGNLFRILSLCTKTPFTIWPSFTWRRGCWETIIMPLKYGTVRFELLQSRGDFYKLQQEKGTKKCCSIELCVCVLTFSVMRNEACMPTTL